MGGDAFAGQVDDGVDVVNSAASIVPLAGSQRISFAP